MTQSKYETPTPEKIAAGKRLVFAREVAGLSQTEAATKLGYCQPVQLSLMESGQRPVPLDKLIAAAKLYDCTADYLCGLADDPGRDPAVAILRRAQAHVAVDVQALVRRVFHDNMKQISEVLPGAAAADRLASLTAEAGVAMALFAARNPEFQDMKAGALLAAKVELAMEAAKAYSQQASRARRLMRTRTSANEENVRP